MHKHADRYGVARNMQSVDDDGETVIGKMPSTVLEGNTFEIGVAKGVLFASGQTVRDIWEAGIGEVIEKKTYGMSIV